MLQALLHSKHRLRYTKETNPFIEDSLTACIFGLLRYLPDAILGKIWIKALFDADKHVFQDIAMQGCFFWPRWRYKDTPSYWCEPDVFCRFTTIDVIIEAKRYDVKRQQDSRQWQNELAAYRDIFGADNKKSLILLAVGGLGEITSKDWRKECIALEQQYRCKIVLLSWSDLWLKCIDPVLENINLSQHIMHIREDMRRSLRLFGIATEAPIPLCTFSSLFSSDDLHFSEASLVFKSDRPAVEKRVPSALVDFPATVENLQLRDIMWSVYQ